MASGGGAHHIIPYKVYLTILLILLGFTVITVVASRIDFGSFNALIAMLIASVKACLVMMFFMHLKYDDRTYPVIFFTGVFCLILMYAFSQLDILTQLPLSDTVR
jgi:cytochrome c oxidase subunit IV